MKRILLAVAAAGGDTKTRLARSLSLTACALLLSIAGANAVTLTAEQQELVKKYNISPADQKKLFATQPVAARPARSERSATANAAPPERQTPPRAYTPENRTPTGGFLANTYVWLGADSYKSIGERITNINGGTGALTGSFGGVGGFNSGFGFGDSPIRFQAGASYGIYDFKGRIRLVPNDTEKEKQVYYTAGLYKRGDMSTERDPFSFGVVYDVFRAEQWGVNANAIELSQVRGIVGYALTESTEVGVWGAYAVDGDRAAVTVAGAPGVLRTIHAMNQTNFYVKHNFDFGGQITAYYGVLSGADIGKWQVGMRGQIPLSPSWSAFADANYVVPRTAAGPLGSGQEQFSVSVGLAYYFGGNAQNPSVTGNRGLPLLEVANNRTFLISD
jgi:hypothetical protein